MLFSEKELIHGLIALTGFISMPMPQVAKLIPEPTLVLHCPVAMLWLKVREPPCRLSQESSHWMGLPLARPGSVLSLL